MRMVILFELLMFLEEPSHISGWGIFYGVLAYVSYSLLFVLVPGYVLRWDVYTGVGVVSGSGIWYYLYKVNVISRSNKLVDVFIMEGYLLLSMVIGGAVLFGVSRYLIDNDDLITLEVFYGSVYTSFLVLFSLMVIFISGLGIVILLTSPEYNLTMTLMIVGALSIVPPLIFGLFVLYMLWWGEGDEKPRVLSLGDVRS